jgi:2-dehydro-3-deoxyphosphogluconate aldolase/(4S)-4-hydroxy-2-oxoglutarate aldolase
VSTSIAALEPLRRQRIVPVLRAEDRRVGLARAELCLHAGLGVIELTASIPGWEEVLREVVASWPDAVVGLGTVTTAEDASRAVDAGASFLVSPFLAPQVHAVGAERGIPAIEAGLTPTEINQAASRGALVKLFPAHAAGPDYIRSVRAVLPEVEVMPTGGVRLEDVHLWLAAGAFAVGVGSDLIESADIDARLRSLRL